MASDILSETRITVALDAIVTAIGNTAVVRLFTEGPIHPDGSAILTDFTEPEGTWYDTMAVPLVNPVYGEKYLNADGEYERRAASVQINFIVADGNDPVDIKGWMVCKADGSEVYHYGYLPATVHLATNLDAVIVEPRIALPKIPAVAA